jgi:biotin carboxyl carrier protein
MHETQIVLRDEHGAEHRARIDPDGVVTVGDLPVSVRRDPDGSIRVLGEQSTVAWTTVAGDTVWVFLDGRVFLFERADGAGTRRRSAAHHGPLTAPMPATVRRIAVAPGDAVRKGDVLVVLEAMKMELPVKAAADGTVVSVDCTEGELVQAGARLIELDGSRR